jgi:hypothetical protein
MDRNHSFAQPTELGGVAGPRLQLKHVYAIYTGQFRSWFLITAPTSLLASVVLLKADQRVRAIFGGIPIREIQYHWSEIGETYVLRFGSFFVSWFLGCLALAAIATAVNAWTLMTAIVFGGATATRGRANTLGRCCLQPCLRSARSSRAWG